MTREIWKVLLRSFPWGELCVASAWPNVADGRLFA